MAANNEGFDDQGFDYDEGTNNAFDNTHMGGLGDAMGLEDEGDLDAMEAALNDAGPGKDTFEVTFSITFDEDDENTLNLNLAEVF